jgi:hypothetical protein
MSQEVHFFDRWPCPPKEFMKSYPAKHRTIAIDDDHRGRTGRVLVDAFHHVPLGCSHASKAWCHRYEFVVVLRVRATLIKKYSRCGVAAALL